VGGQILPDIFPYLFIVCKSKTMSRIATMLGVQEVFLLLEDVVRRSPLSLLLIGIWIGWWLYSSSSADASSSSSSSSFPSSNVVGSLSSLAAHWLPHKLHHLLMDQSIILESILLPMYSMLVVAYLTALIFRKQLQPVSNFLRSSSRCQQERTAPVLAGPTTHEPNKVKEENEIENDNDDNSSTPQPIDLTGVYKLISNDNFEGFLAVQGVSWALRRAANQARPTHRITHRGRKLTIRIEGLIESQTTYWINGPPVETNVRGRIFQDVVQYLDNHKGILVSKKALTDDYDVTVQRELSDDRQEITMTSTAYFRDGRDPVQCIQRFRRCE